MDKRKQELLERIAQLGPLVGNTWAEILGPELSEALGSLHLSAEAPLEARGLSPQEENFDEQAFEEKVKDWGEDFLRFHLNQEIYQDALEQIRREIHLSSLEQELQSREALFAFREKLQRIQQKGQGKRAQLRERLQENLGKLFDHVWQREARILQRITGNRIKLHRILLMILPGSGGNTTKEDFLARVKEEISGIFPAHAEERLQILPLIPYESGVITPYSAGEFSWDLSMMRVHRLPDISSFQLPWGQVAAQNLGVLRGKYLAAGEEILRKLREKSRREILAPGILAQALSSACADRYAGSKFSLGSVLYCVSFHRKNQDPEGILGAQWLSERHASDYRVSLELYQKPQSKVLEQGREQLRLLGKQMKQQRQEKNRTRRGPGKSLRSQYLKPLEAEENGQKSLLPGAELSSSLLPPPPALQPPSKEEMPENSSQ